MVFDQHEQQVERARAEFHRLAIGAKLALGREEIQVSDAYPVHAGEIITVIAKIQENFTDDSRHGR
jgi:hypothetical protein